jgi:hypothetical protein
MLPGANGYQVCRVLRDEGNWTPILMLTAKTGAWDEVEGLDTGADDYLAKPFSYAVLVARLRALLRRGVRPRPTVIQAGALRLDPRHAGRVAGTQPCTNDIPVMLHVHVAERTASTAGPPVEGATRPFCILATEDPLSPDSNGGTRARWPAVVAETAMSVRVLSFPCMGSHALGDVFHQPLKTMAFASREHS